MLENSFLSKLVKTGELTVSRKRVIFWGIFLFLSYFGILFYQKIAFLKAFYSGECQIKTGFFDKAYQNIDAISEDIREYYSDDRNLSLKLKYSDRTVTAKAINQPNNIQNRRKSDFISENDEKSEPDFIPENYEKYKTDFTKYVLRRINEPKEYKKRSFDELNKLPGNPHARIFRTTARLWAHVSILLGREGFDTESLLTAYAPIYMALDYQNNYQTGMTVLSRVLCCAYVSISINELLQWAEKPRKSSAEYSKLVAKDLLLLVANEPPLSESMKLELVIIERFLKSLAKRCNISAILALLSSQWKNKWNLYSEFMECIDNKKYYEYKNELEKHFKIFYDDINNPSRSKSGIVAILYMTFLPINDMGNELVGIIPNFNGFIASVETKLAKMEFTAIALAYNSFHAENGRVPDSMEELEKWFGQSLPINRITGKPYKFFEKEGYTLYYDELFYEFGVTNRSYPAFGFRFSEQ